MREWLQLWHEGGIEGSVAPDAPGDPYGIPGRAPRGLQHSAYDELTPAEKARLLAEGVKAGAILGGATSPPEVSSYHKAGALRAPRAVALADRKQAIDPNARMPINRIAATTERCSVVANG